MGPEEFMDIPLHNLMIPIPDAYPGHGFYDCGANMGKIFVDKSFGPWF